MSNQQAQQTAVAILTAAAGQDSKLMAEIINEVTLKDAQGTLASLAGMTVACLENLSQHMGVSVDQFLAQMGAIASLE